MKKGILTCSLLAVVALVSCVPPASTSSTQASSSTNSTNNNIMTTPTSSSSSSSSSSSFKKETNKPTTIYLAGDSTVKTYENEQYIAGWGQYLDLFLGDDVKVVNAAQGGRSSRSFINEGRLYDIDDSDFNYSFSQNNGNSIGDVIKEGDFLFIQFGHNDDASKLSNYSTIFDRMVPLGTPDENGIYPTTPATKMPTSQLPDEYKNAANDSEETKALTEIAKYGSSYYAYNSGGTYKWYLKQYIDFARSKNATPVLITPVARVKFSNNEIVGGAGLHGDNFAYVQAVRQLATEENCLLIDLFDYSKTMLETATPTYANYLMALKPNELKGTWPRGYDETYGNGDSGYTGIEATHYNKYAAFLQAAKIAEEIKESEPNEEEYYSFQDFVLDIPESYIDPSNLIGKNTVKNIEQLHGLSVTNPNRVYPDPNEVIEAINNLKNKEEVTSENYLEIKDILEKIQDQYFSLNIDDRASVSNYQKVLDLEEKINELIEASRPKPISTTTYEFGALATGTFTENIQGDGFTIYASSDKNVEIKSSKVSAQYNGETYSANMLVKLGGTAKYGTGRYIGFNVDKACKVTVLCASSGSSVRSINIVDSSYKPVGSYVADTAATFGSVDIEKAGTYYIGSTGSGVYVYMIIIEYYE